jgi:DNA replication protein DnaC
VQFPFYFTLLFSFSTQIIIEPIFPDSMAAVAAIDRIVHHSTIINITGESYRKKNSQYKNVFENGGENVIRN